MNEAKQVINYQNLHDIHMIQIHSSSAINQYTQTDTCTTQYGIAASIKLEPILALSDTHTH